MAPAVPPAAGRPRSGPDRRTVLRATACAAAGTGASAVTGRARAAAAPAPAAPLPLPAEDLPLRADERTQGDVLAGFRKDHVCLLFLHFREVSRARRWLAALVPEVSTTAEVARFNAAFSAARRGGGSDPVSLSALWTGLGLTHPGLRLLAGKEPFPATPPGSCAEAFAQGAAARAPALGDTGPSAPRSWLFGAEGPEQAVHAVLTLAADDPERLATAIARHRDAAVRADALVLFRQDGATLPGELRGHEHFGFLDCVSQPGVRGFDPVDPATGRTALGRPGTRMLPAGEFLVGPERVGQRPAGLPAWATGGSFQVVRRLAQDVPAWWTQVGLRLAELKRSGAAPADATAPWLAARLVGRWPGGMPVALCPAAERLPGPDEDPDAALDFGADPHGWRMPLFAHIRKANPRGGLVLTPGRPPLADAELDGHRMIRRGIPYGPVHRPDGGAGHGPDTPRGLLFVSHQADLVQQFEFVARRWLNEADFPPGRHPRTGTDPVLGPDAPLAFETPAASGSRATPLYFGRFVRTEGAVYAFSPAIPVLRALASGALDDAVEIHPGTVLRPGDVLDAGAVRLVLDASGDLALLDRRGRGLWSAGTGGVGHDALFGHDGELTVRTAAGRPGWSSGTARHPGARLLLRPAGDLVLLDGDRTLWRAPTTAGVGRP
ncbi:peroxidase [Streptomyces sp. NPDC051555]|uniref:peroxidase n=1 Tax=Streptomyces sp. NPDC051555 TaxID=3365657 RepID=UPI0037879ABA